MKKLPAMQELQGKRVQSLGREDPLEEEMATPSSNLAWRIPWTEEPSRIQSVGSQRVGHGRSDLACTQGLVVKALDLVDRTGKSDPSPLVPHLHFWRLLQGLPDNGGCV